MFDQKLGMIGIQLNALQKHLSDFMKISEITKDHEHVRGS